MNFITFLLISTTLLCIFFTVIRAEEECLYGKINCYDCNSKENEGCGDPFNSTAVAAPRMCHGCCVKMVQYRNTPDEYIRRTCTKELDINLFMVDHICMDASDGMGHMCFCESSNCNSAISLRPFKGLDKYVILFLIVCSSFLTNMYDNFRKF